MKFNKSNNQLNIAEIEEEEPDNSIMVVDDSKFARNILCDILRNDGFHVVAEAKNGLEAVELTKEKKPKYIFLDVEMPMLDGLGAIPRILEADPQAHIIMCTAMGQKNIIVEAAKAGAKDYVIKPYKKENILRVLNVIIESKRKPVTTLESDIEIDGKGLPNQKQLIHSKQQDMEAKYLIPQSERPEYKKPEYKKPEYSEPKYIEPEFIEPEQLEPEHIEPEFIEPEHIEPEQLEPEHIEPEFIEPEHKELEYIQPEYIEPEHIEPEFIEPEHIKPEHIEPEHKELEYIQPEYIEPEHIEPEFIEPEHIKPEHKELEYIQPEYIEPEHIEPEFIAPEHIESWYIEPEYIEDEYNSLKNEKPELKEELKSLTFKEEAEDTLGDINEQGITSELEPEPLIQGDFIELLSFPQDAETIDEAGNSTSAADVTLAGEETAASVVLEELIQSLPEQENSELSAEAEIYKEAEVIIDNSGMMEVIPGTEANEGICESSEIPDTEVENFIQREAEIQQTNNTKSFPDTGKASETEVTEKILDAGETSKIGEAPKTGESEDMDSILESVETLIDQEAEYILETEEESESEETTELIEILESEEDSELKFLLEAITDYDYCEGISDADTTGKKGARKANHKPVRLRSVKEASNELTPETVTDYYSYTYLWRNRFDLMPEDIPARPVSEQRMPFHNVVQLKRNDSFLTDIDNSCNGILSGLASAYLGRKRRLQTDELGISMDKQANYYQDGARVFINTILEDKSGDNADIAMSDLLILSEAKEQNIVKIQVKSLSDAVRQLVCKKAGRNLI